jgi:ABC-type glycerol-3-phosphate transport system permease component
LGLSHITSFAKLDLITKPLFIGFENYIDMFTVESLFWLMRSSLMTSRGIFTVPLLPIPTTTQWGNNIDLFKAVPFAGCFLNTVLIVLPLPLLFFFMQRYFFEGLTMGGLKG